MGLTDLIVKYSTLMADYGDTIALTNQHIAVPGGSTAEPIWARLAGASPQMPIPFLRALFEKDQGRLLAFYSDLSQADIAHQQYFMHSAERAEAYYKWYRDSAPPTGVARRGERWQATLLQRLHLDSSGQAVVPGGRSAWPNGGQGDDGMLLGGAPLDALIAISELEESAVRDLARSPRAPWWTTSANGAVSSPISKSYRTSTRRNSVRWRSSPTICREPRPRAVICRWVNGIRWPG
ncbi:MAG: hypothetical protein WDO73_20530 [Ignavibacteriota bacterium]